MDLIYSFSRKVLRGFFKGFCGLEVRGIENAPDRDGLIVVANHVSNFDPPVLGAALNRKVHYMAKEELFDNFLLRRLMDTYGAFPVKRGRGDMSAIKNSLQILRKGQVLGLFPEGTRSKSGKLRKAKLGTVLLAVKSEVPILPVGLIGTQNLFSNKVVVNIGEIFTLDDYYGRKLSKGEMRAAGEEIMVKISNLLN